MCSLATAVALVTTGLIWHWSRRLAPRPMRVAQEIEAVPRRERGSSTSPRRPELRAPADDRHAEPARPPAPAETPAAAPPRAGSPFEAALTRVEGSGPASGGWTTAAWDVLAKVRSLSSGRFELTNFRCFELGCAVAVRFPNRQTFDDTDKDLDRSEGLDQWPGPKFRSAPKPDGSGAIQATWILFHPVDHPPLANEDITGGSGNAHQ